MTPTAAALAGTIKQSSVAQTVTNRLAANSPMLDMRDGVR